jgi:hypothetical protein
MYNNILIYPWITIWHNIYDYWNEIYNLIEYFSIKIEKDVNFNCSFSLNKMKNTEKKKKDKIQYSLYKTK